MNAPEWVLRETVLAVQERLLSEFGGLGGLRELGLLESALARPRQLHAVGSPDIIDIAAAYASGLAGDYSFTAGNKRVAFTTAVLFLELNGYRFQASEADATVQTLGLAAREITEEAYAAWLRANCVAGRTDRRT